MQEEALDQGKKVVKVVDTSNVVIVDSTIREVVLERLGQEDIYIDPPCGFGIEDWIGSMDEQTLLTYIEMLSGFSVAEHATGMDDHTELDAIDRNSLYFDTEQQQWSTPWDNEVLEAVKIEKDGVATFDLLIKKKSV